MRAVTDPCYEICEASLSRMGLLDISSDSILERYLFFDQTREILTVNPPMIIRQFYQYITKHKDSKLSFLFLLSRIPETGAWPESSQETRS